MPDVVTERDIKAWMRSYLTEPKDAVTLQIATIASDVFPYTDHMSLVRLAAEVLRELRGEAPLPTLTFSTHTRAVNPVHTRVAVYNRGGLAGELCVNTQDAREFQRRINRRVGDD